MSNTKIGCRLYTFIGRSKKCSAVEDPALPPNKSSVGRVTDDMVEKRGGTAPDGMVLADWQTYLSYVTTINDTPYTVTTIANLPLTYYGASIPLGDGWTYGGLTSPTGTDQLAPPMTDTVESSTSTPTRDIPSSTTTPLQLSTSADSTTSTNGQSSSATTSASMFSLTSSSYTQAVSSSSTASSPWTSSSVSFVPDPINPLPTSDPTQPPMPTTSTTEASRNLLAPLLGALIPLVLTVLVLLIFFCVYHKNRHSRDSRFFGVFSKSKWSSISPGPQDTSSKGKSREIGETNDVLGAAKSPTEKSALLPGWTAQHHRNSASIDRRDEQEVDDELRDLAKQNNSLLQKLNLGLGWLTPSGSSNSSGSSGTSGNANGNRKASGNTLERGQGKRVFSPATLATAAAAGLIGLGFNKNKNKRMTNLTTSTSGTNEGYKRVLEDDQLFFSVPRRNESSTAGSRTGSATGSPSIPTVPTSSGDRSSNHYGNRLSPPAEIRGMGMGHQADFSVGIPETPNTDAPDLSMDLGDMVSEGRRRARWSEDGERINFPIPPGIGLGLYDDGTFGRPPRIGEGSEGGRRESYLSGDTDYYSAPSHSSSSHIPPTGIPIPRDTEEYRHVSVSAFGSHPSTPTRPTRFSQAESSPPFHPTPQGETRPVRLVSPLISPSKPKAIAQRPVSGVGSTFHSIRNLFSSTPTPSPGVHGEYEGGSGDKRRSYVGQPIVDDKLRRTDRSIGEFGEPLKQSALVASTVMSPRPSHSSEQASVHLSIPSQYHSHSSHSTSGSSNDPTEASHEPVLRGKRSKGKLLRASKIGELQRPTPLPLQDRQTASSSSRLVGVDRREARSQEETPIREWEENIDEFMAQGEELPPLTPDRDGMRDKGLRNSWLGRW